MVMRPGANYPKKEIKKKLASVGCSFHLTDEMYAINGNPPMYHVIVQQSKGVPAVGSVFNFQTLNEINEFVVAKRAADASESLEAAQEIMEAGGF